MPEAHPVPVKDTIPKGVSLSHSGLTVWRSLTRREMSTHVSFGLFTAACVLVYALPSSVWALVPPEHLEGVVELVSNLFLAAPFCVSWALYAGWRFATQPTLRVTRHAIILAPRWAAWRPTQRYSLGEVDIRAGREPWVEGIDCAAIHFDDGETRSVLRLEPLAPDAEDTGAAKLEWVMGHLKAAQGTYVEDEEDERQRAEEALTRLRHHAIPPPERQR